MISAWVVWVAQSSSKWCTALLVEKFKHHLLGSGSFILYHYLIVSLTKRSFFLLSFFHSQLVRGALPLPSIFSIYLQCGSYRGKKSSSLCFHFCFSTYYLLFTYYVFCSHLFHSQYLFEFPRLTLNISYKNQHVKSWQQLILDRQLLYLHTHIYSTV